MDDLPRVGFDGLFLEQPHTGSGRYALNIWRGLGSRFKASSLSLHGPAGSQIESMAFGHRWTSAWTPPGPPKARKLWWEQIGLPLSLWEVDPKPDLLHVPYFSAPAIKSVPYVITVHDLIPLTLADYRGSRSMAGYLRLVTNTVRSAALVLTDSEYSRQEILRHIDLPAARVRSIPLAADPQFSPPETDHDDQMITAARVRFGLDRPYIINTGGLDVRKNVQSIIEGFALASKEANYDHDLVIVGRAHTNNPALYPRLDRIARRYGVAERVRFVGAVPDSDFVNLYRGADMFVFASRYEGFGLTPLEAMACGVATISTGGSSLDEVIADAAHRIEPTAKSVAAGIVRLVDDPGLRADLAKRGVDQARRFSWDRTVDLTVAAYRDACNGVGR